MIMNTTEKWVYSLDWMVGKMIKLSKPRIVCAAIRRLDNDMIIVGARHFDHIMVEQIKARNESGEWRTAEQGFIDQHCKFWNREDAWKIADENDQIWRDRD